MKKMLKPLSLLMAVLMMVTTLTACSGKNVTADATVYAMQSYEREISDYGTDWIFEDDYTLLVFSDNTYILTLSRSGVGYADIAGRGEQRTTYYGTYTSAENTSLGEGFMDFTLEKATRVTYSQKLQMGLYFGGEYSIDSSAKEWTEEIVDASGYESAEAFMNEKATGFKITVDTAKSLITELTTG